MSAWDYLPHRLLINKSLRMEAEGLRTRIDSYQIEYDNRVESCQEELEHVEVEYQKKFNLVKESLIQELQDEQGLLEGVAQDITSYADAYMHRACLYQIRDIKENQIDILREDNDFLSGQMAYIGQEIDLLRERQNELTACTDVKDIIQLASLSGYEIGFKDDDDAKALLDKVSQAISKCGQDKGIERFALVRLKGIIQERSEYLPTIKYITWVIQQKILFSKQLSEKRKAVGDSQTLIRQEINQLEDQINSTTESIVVIAQRIRFYWAQPITYLSADISYAYKEKKEMGDSLRDVGQELHSMASWHSDDQEKWDRLQRERRDLSSDFDSLKSSIDSKKKERSQWFEKKNYIFQVCKENGVPLIPEKKTQTDEERIIGDRLAELDKIREEGTAEAQRIYEQEREALIFNYNEARRVLEGDLSSLEEELGQIESDYEQIESKVCVASQKVKQIKNEDDRFFLAKVFSETPGLQEAKNTLALLKKNLAVTNQKKARKEDEIEEARKKISELDKQHDKDLRRCRPRALRPTASESKEEKKLLYRKAEIEKRRKEGGHANKN